MFTRHEGLDDIINIRATMLDDHAWFRPFVEFWTDEKLPWAATPAVQSYATEPEFDEFAGLIEEYAARGTRPG